MIGKDWTKQHIMLAPVKNILMMNQERCFEGGKSIMKRINSLEGLRGVAAVMVLFSHLGVMFYPAYYWTGIQGHSRFIEHFFGRTRFLLFYQVIAE